MTINITYSSELMQNYKQAEVVAPDAQFEALQTNEGHSLLFSIGTDHVFYLTREAVDHSTGWEKMDLSYSLAQFHHNSPVIAKTFTVSQSNVSRNVDIVLAVTVEGQDYLYLSRQNSNSDISWSRDLQWMPLPFDDPNHSFSRIEIVDIYIAQAHDGEYIVVDIIKQPDSPQKFVYRYYIDPSRQATGQIWNSHNLPADLEPDQIKSCLGRRAEESVDGMYSVGDINDHLELLYTPLYNEFDPHVPVNPIRLEAPESASALAVASVDGTFTDLFVAGKHALYYFPSDQQKDGQSGIKVFENEIFLDVQKLFAYATSTKFIVWGLNREQEIFYTTCNKADVQNPSAWSYPLSLLKGVEQLTPYVNCVNDGNTFFAHVGSNQFKKAVQSPETTIWRYQDILLSPPTQDAKSLRFDSYTTRIHLTDDQNSSLSGKKIQLAALDRCSVYINNHYSVLDQEPIEIASDGAGGITIVEPIHSLRGSCLRIYDADGHFISSINPMDTPKEKIAQLDSIDKLNSATIEHRTAGSTPRSLVSSDVSDADKQAVVDSIQQLKTVSQSLPADGSVRSTTPATPAALSSIPHDQVFALSATPVVSGGFHDFTSAIEVTAGDMISFLENVGRQAVQIFVVAVEEAWHFVAKIGEKAYRFVIDCAQKIAHAFATIFNAIKVFIKDLIDYVKFLFKWEDFVRTKNVYKKLLLFYFDHVLEGVTNFKADFHKIITEAKGALDNWADIEHDTDSDVASQPMQHQQTKADSQSAFSSPAMFLFQHFSDNVSNSRESTESHESHSLSDQQVQSLGDLLDSVLQIFEDEKNVLHRTVKRVQSELIDDSKFKQLSFGEVLKKLTAILVDGILDGIEALVDPLIDIFVMLAREAIKALDTPIWIPVISDIIEDFGGSSFSLLDIILMIGAIPATLVHKGIHHAPPFSPDDGFSDKILNAKDLNALRAAFASSGGGGGGVHSITPYEINSTMPPGIQPMMSMAASGLEQTPFVPIQLPENVQSIIFAVGRFIGGMAATLGGIFVIVDGMAIYMKKSKEFERTVMLTSIVGGLSAGLTAILAQPYPLKDKNWGMLANICTAGTLLGKLVFFVIPRLGLKRQFARPRLELHNPSDVEIETWRLIGGVCDMVFAVLAIFPTIAHFVELSKEKASRYRSESIIIDTSNICVYVSRVGSFAVQMIKVPPATPQAKGILVIATGTLVSISGLLQIVAYLVEAFGGMSDRNRAAESGAH